MKYQQEWTGKKVLIIGAARQGLALARFLTARGAQVTLNDQRHAFQMIDAKESLADLPQTAQVRWEFGGHPLSLLDHTDVVCVSGGVSLELPIIVEAIRRGLPLTNDSQIFLEEVRAPVIGITGSAGKTTTTTLVGRMAQHLASTTGRRAWIGGNIGLPLIEYVDQIHADDMVVVELSSFQLELMTISPGISAVLNITPNHLDRHATLEAYTAAKARILTCQTSADTAVLSREDPGSWGLRDLVKGELVTFGIARPAQGMAGSYIHDHNVWFTDGTEDTLLFGQSQVLLRGEHNLRNVLAACALAAAARWPISAICAGIDGFSGVAHRLEHVRDLHGAAWYNDSIATAPERTIAAINAFDEPLVLLLGGRDKKLPWAKLAQLVHQRVDHVIVFGEAADIILQAMGMTQPGKRLQTIDRADGLKKAVQTAAKIAQPGDVVLFSPGGTSFDEFFDFEERGERFREWVKELS